MLNALGEEGNSGRLTVLARVPSGLGAAAEGGRVAGGVRGEGADGGQRAGSRLGGSGYPAQPSHPQLARGGRGKLRPPPTPAVCISLAGGGARLERNGLSLERCLFFLTSQCTQTTR